MTASASSVVHRTTNSGTNWNTQAIAGPDSYGCSAITADGTHVIVGRGDGLEYTNDAFDAAGAWVTSGAGGSAMTVAGVSPSKTSAIGDADGCDCEPSVTDGYKVYYGYDPATPFVVSGPTFVWNTGVPTIVGSGSPSLNWTGVTLSNNGRFALATATGEKIKTASNWGSPGAQWGTLANSPAEEPLALLNWFGIAARRDLNTGSFGTIAAIERPGSIWMSFDNGAAWAAMPGTSGKNWSGITCKSDGSAFAATVDGENIWIYPFTSTTTTTSSICGPVPPRLWSRAQPDCIHTSATLTQQDLDMRRKAEILQYKNNNSNMSKKQLWARTIKGHGPSGNRTWATQSADGTYTNPNIDNLKPSGAFTLRCPGRPNNCAPTSNSDVPGKADDTLHETRCASHELHSQSHISSWWYKMAPDRMETWRQRISRRKVRKESRIQIILLTSVYLSKKRLKYRIGEIVFRMKLTSNIKWVIIVFYYFSKFVILTFARYIQSILFKIIIVLRIDFIPMPMSLLYSVAFIYS